MLAIAYQPDSPETDKKAPAKASRKVKSVIHRIWPTAIIAFGLTLTVVWMCFLGYALVKIIEMAI
jgi:hypothetical protein